MKKVCIFGLMICLLVYTGCRESYDPPAISSNQTYLVVEGSLNAGAGATSIRITRTFKLDDTARLRGEPNAILTIEGEDGSMAGMTESINGYYTATGLNLVLGNQYRLRIKTADGLEYLSDYVVAKKTPPIDKISWKRVGQDVQLLVSTHDPANDTRYYRWEFDETWEIRSYYYSLVKYEWATNTVRNRTMPDEQVYACWKYGSSNSIMIGSSARLAEDVINEAPLNTIGFRDERIEQRYSILVRQYGLSAAAHSFYELMKRNTEDVGSVFGPLPSELRGNIRCITDPSVYVLGFVTANTMEEKRFFIEKSDVPDWSSQRFCADSLVANDPAQFLLKFLPGSLLPHTAQEGPPGMIMGYHSSSPECVDCTVRGGSTQRPSYW